MKPKSLKSEHSLVGSVLKFVVSEVGGSGRGQVEVDLSTLLGGQDALPALAFAVRTKLRNATGGRPFEEAISAIQEIAEALNRGKWATVVAREPGEPRISPLVRAIANILYGGNTDAALEEYQSSLAALAAQNGVDLDPEDDEGKAALRKLKAAYKRTLMANQAIKRELLRLEVQAEEEALRRKREALNQLG